MRRDADRDVRAPTRVGASVKWFATSAVWLSVVLPTVVRADPPEPEKSDADAAEAAPSTDEPEAAPDTDAAVAAPSEPEAGTQEEAARAEPADAGPKEAAAEIAPSPKQVAKKKAKARTKPRRKRRLRCPKCPPAPVCCDLRVDAGPRFGVSVNGDQWIAGGHFRFPVPCLGGLTVEPVLLAGFGGNWLTWRPSLRLLYLFWIGGEQGVGIYPSVGRSIFFRMPNPFSHFSSFCYRTKLDECWGWGGGFELGGGLQYRWLGIDALVGWGELPVVTINATATFTLWGSGT